MHCLLLAGRGRAPADQPADTLRLLFDAWDAGPGEISLPGVMADELLELRAEHAAWAYETGKLPLGGGTIADALRGGSPLSMWWCSVIYERHPKVSPDLFDLYRLRCLERLLERHGVTSLGCSGLTERCARAVEALCAARGIPCVCLDTVPAPKKSLLRRLYAATPAPVRAAVRFAVWLWQVKRHLPSASLPEAPGKTGTIVTYFPNIALPEAEKGVFRSRYFESLHDALAEDADPPAVRWVFVRFPSPQGSLKDCCGFRDAFRKTGKSGVSFHYLEEFLKVPDMLSSLGRYLRIAWKSLAAERELKSRFRLAGSRLDLWPLLGPDFVESFRGWRCLERCLQQKGLENYVRLAGPQRWYSFPMENCPWERMLTHAVHRLGTGPVLGAQHSTIRPTDFRYFDDPRTWTDPETIPFQPDRIFGNGESACAQWRACRVPAERLGKVEALRYLYLCDMLAGKAPEEGAAKGRRKILVVTSFFADETEAHLELLAACLKEGILSPEELTVKPHPYLPVERSLERLLGSGAAKLRISMAPMPEELAARPAVWASNSTTAVLEAALMGLPVLVMQPAGDFDLCPLQDIPGLVRTSDTKSVRRALENLAPLAVPEGYLCLDKNLPRWRDLLGLARHPA